MTNVSKRPLSKKQNEQLFNQFNLALTKLNKDSVDKFLINFLGHEEQLMLAKRFAALILLEEGVSIKKTASFLNMSSSTVSNLQNKFTSTNFSKLIGVNKKTKTTTRDYRKMLETLDNILQLGGMLPYYNSKDRWKGKI